jgi:hypothetical protein
MSNRKFKVNPPYFLFRALGGLGGLTAVYFGLKDGSARRLRTTGISRQEIER